MPKSSCRISVIYPTDPLGPNVGGIKPFINGFIKYAPDDFSVELIGISSNYYTRPPKKWTMLKSGDKSFNFFPLFFEKNENKKTLIPLSLRFTLALKFSNLKIKNRILFFNRIEPALVFKKAAIPKILTVHSDVTNQVKRGKGEVYWSKFPWLYFIFENFILTYLDLVYTVNKNTLDFYQSKYPDQRDKFVFLPNWADTDLFFPLKEPKQVLRRKLFSIINCLPIMNDWILFVGRLQKTKAPFRLIDTFFEYYKRNKSSNLVIAGEGNLKQSIKAYIKKLNIEKNVLILGNRNHTELPLLYNASDVLLLTSNYEGMPISVLEALACGIPVVSTNVGEVKRVLRNGFSGEVVESFSPNIISQSLRKVLKNPNNYSKNNCLNAVSDYTPKKQLEPVYENMRELYMKMNNYVKA